ncbi:MAG: hypothetical protein P8009_00505 [Gammaproteobacteria bacterium]|nr:hypothetical protein [Gammaproteobacteria bacterium]
MKRQKGTTPRVNNEGRRNFMRTLAIGGGAAGLVAATARFATEDETPSRQGAEAGTQPATSKGYHVTPHIEEYYRKAAL